MNFAQYLAMPVRSLDQWTPPRPSERDKQERVERRARRTAKLEGANHTKATELYQKVRAATGKIFSSRDVALELDYNPTAACKICKKMVERRHARIIDRVQQSKTSYRFLYEWVE